MVFQTWAELTAANPQIAKTFERAENQNNLSSLRTGIFTASEVWKLFTTKRKPAENDTSRGYIQVKAIEAITKERFDVPFLAKATEHGKEFEPEAIELYEKLHKVKAESIGDDQQFFKCKNIELGATPDGFVEIKGERLMLEIKCPFNLMIHLENLENAHSIEWFIENRYKYYIQIQAGLFSTGLKNALFMSYGAHKKVKEDAKLVVIKIPYDTDFVENKLIPTVEAATELREKEIQRYSKYMKKE